MAVVRASNTEAADVVSNVAMSSAAAVAIRFLLKRDVRLCMDVALCRGWGGNANPATADEMFCNRGIDVWVCIVSVCQRTSMRSA